MNTDLKVQSWDIDKVIPYEKNAKTHPGEQVKRIAQSIREFGWDQPIVVDNQGVIIKGHGRRLAAIELGLKKVPVLVRGDLSPDQVRASRLGDNRAAMSDIDTDLLKQELSDLDFDLTGIFDAKELKFLEGDIMTLDTSAFDVTTPALDGEPTDPTGGGGAAEVKRADGKQVSIAQALGFKSIPVSAQRSLNRFLAKLEEDYKLPADQAFVAFIDEMTKEAA